MICDAAAGRTTVIPCDPEFAYHYVYVDDVADALIAALEAERLQHFEYIVDGGEPMVMRGDRGNRAGAIPNARIELVAGADYAPDVQTRFDISRIATDLGWRPRFDLRRGIGAYRRRHAGGGRIEQSTPRPGTEETRRPAACRKSLGVGGSR